MKICEFISILVSAILLTLAVHVLIINNMPWYVVLVIIVGFTLLVGIVIRWVSFRKEKKARQIRADKLRMQLISFEEADRRANRDYLCRGQYPSWRG